MIEIKNFNKNFNTSHGILNVLKDFSLTIEDGTFLGVHGKSGAGKSTLLTILAGLQPADSGSIIINGKEIIGADERELAAYRNQNIGFISQEQSFLENLNVIDNVRLPAFLNKKKIDNESAQAITTRANQLLSSLGIAHLAKSYPSTLSGGENHRVLIARALINNPSIILADEPTDSVDSERTEEIIKIFRRLADEGKTILIVSHDSEALKLCDKEIKI